MRSSVPIFFANWVTLCLNRTALSSDLTCASAPLHPAYTPTDAIVACGRLEVVENTLTNPVLIAEVLSESTEAYDRGKKFAAYRQIECLSDYLLIDQTQTVVEHFQKEQDGTWRLREYSSREETLAIETIGVTLRMSEIYRKVDFGA
jgi:Uma2 family endonuclease